MGLENIFKLIIFDCDGTLVDSESLTNKLIADMMIENGVPMSEELSLKLFKGTHFAKITDYLQERISHLNKEEFEREFRLRCSKLFETQLQEIQGASEFIAQLKIPYCIASNGPRVKMMSSLGATGLIRFFSEDRIFSAYDIGKFKPDPSLFLHVCKSQTSTPEQTLVIEDTLPGIEAARNAGMEVWAIHHPGINDEIIAEGIPLFKNYDELKYNI